MHRIIIADSSMVVRKLLSTALSNYEDIEVCGVCETGLEAYQTAFEENLDLALIDYKISKPDCAEVITRISKEISIPIIIMVPNDTPKEVKSNFIKLGAVCTIDKPKGFDYDSIMPKLNKMIKTYTSFDENKNFKPIQKYNKTKDFKPEILCIGSSTGGPDALAKVLPKITNNINIPVIIVQHITAGYNENLVKWLQPYTELKVKIPENNESLKPNIIYLPASNKQLIIKTNKTIEHSDEKLHSFICPSIDLTFHSVVRAYKKNVLGVILTGMGRDGAFGMEQIYKSGGYTIAQNKETCVVFGMPKVAIEKNVVDNILPIDKIGEQIASFF
ncbi:MAG: chemotaxis protein CheB [Candidatus Sericytochromatia bacterium]